MVYTCHKSLHQIFTWTEEGYLLKKKTKLLKLEYEKHMIDVFIHELRENVFCVHKFNASK